MHDVEAFAARWNEERRREAEARGQAEEGEYARVLDLRRTGFLCLDIEIPDPGVGEVEDEVRLEDGVVAGLAERGAHPVSLSGEKFGTEPGASTAGGIAAKASMPDMSGLQGQRAVEAK